VDPLFLLNHLHYLDMNREGGTDRRPVVFSRYAGPGSHRTPIGFSGDTYQSWESLAYQPYMTATAANAAFPFWSHDIGGHNRGMHDGVLYARWVQFACLSPILRLHSSNNPFCLRMPWAYDRAACEAACDAMRLRHQLIPYIYSATRKTHLTAEPLVMPMYYRNPNDEDAYAAPAQYWFGGQLVAAPMTAPMNPETNLTRQIVWLPGLPQSNGQKSAVWRHLLTGEVLEGNRWHAVYGDLNYIPVFAPSGAIVPMALPVSGYVDKSIPTYAFNSTENPKSMLVHVFAGGSGSFDLFEDEEQGKARSFVTHISCNWQANLDAMTIRIFAPYAGDIKCDDSVDSSVPLNKAVSLEELGGVLPSTRTWHIRVVGVLPSTEATIRVGGIEAAGRKIEPDEIQKEEEAVIYRLSDIPITDSVELVLTGSTSAGIFSARDRTKEKAVKMIQGFALGNAKKLDLHNALPTILDDPTALNRVPTFEKVRDPLGTLFTVSPSMKLALFETIDGSGCGRSFLARPTAPAVIWAGKDSCITGEAYPHNAGSSKDIEKSMFVVRREKSRKSDKARVSNRCESRIIWPRTGQASEACETLFVDLGEVVNVQIPLRDHNDDEGWPIPTML
jgi:hypothetical protein